MRPSFSFRHRCSAFLGSSLWPLPVACMAVALLAAPWIRELDERTRWTLLGFGTDGARAVLAALAASLLTFIVFVFSIILLTVQIAVGQLSPRLIARILQTRLVRFSLSAFVFSFAYVLTALGRIEDRVPQLPVLLSILLSLFSIVLFVWLIQGVSQSVRPAVILTSVGGDTRIAIAAAYPRPFATHAGGHAGPGIGPVPVRRTVVHGGRSGVVLAFDAAGLAEIAARAGCTIELVPQVGDFVAVGDDLFRLYGDRADVVSAGRLRGLVALGAERALRHDPAFGFRILVDVASKALSPAVNDPTTAVLAIDQLHHLLHMLGQRQLDGGIVRDASGEVRLAYRTPGWEDFVTLAVTEIRLYGATSPTVMRRLRGMFEHLVRVVPAARAGTLRKEMELLQRTIERGLADPEDRILAGVGDRQGLGSAPRIDGPEGT